jgi:hypothetical protein
MGLVNMTLAASLAWRRRRRRKRWLGPSGTRTAYAVKYSAKSKRGFRLFITNVKGTFFGMSEWSSRRSCAI